MLATENRLVRPEEFRVTVRRGRRSAGVCLVVHVLGRIPAHPTRFGFIVGRQCGGAVSRNRVKRRLRSASRALLATTPPGLDIVVRALPASTDATWVSLHTEIAEGIERFVAST